VSKQETDVGGQRAERDEGDGGLEQATVRRLEQTAGLREESTPVRRVVTARNTDIGCLIDAGFAAAAGAVRMAAFQAAPSLRAVPEIYSAAAAHRRGAA